MLVIVSILLGMGVSALLVYAQNAAVSATKQRQLLIRDVLSTYLGKYKRLPCPDLLGVPGNVPGTGDDNRTTPNNVNTQCAADVGVVPYIDLGLPRDVAFDGWDNYFTYRLTTDANLALDWSRSGSFAVGKPGKLVVSERNPPTNPALTPMTGPENAVVVLVSHGKNGLGAWTAQGTQNVAPTANTDEMNNADGVANFQFVMREPTDVLVPTYGAYDDFVAYFKATDLIAPLAKDGTFRTAEGETNRALSDATDSIIGASISAATLPPAPILPNDGWGRPLAYNRLFAGQIRASTPPGPAFTVTSYGADGVAGSTDDVVQATTVSSLQTIYGKTGTLLP